LALLLASFGSNVLTEKEDEENKIGEAINRIQRFFCLFGRRKKKTFIEDHINETVIYNQISNLPLPSNTSVLLNNDLPIIHEDIEMQSMNNNSITSSPTWEIIHMPPDCCPKIISKHCTCCDKCIPKRWTYIRSLAHYFVEHRYFELIIIISILISSITLVS